MATANEFKALPKGTLLRIDPDVIEDSLYAGELHASGDYLFLFEAYDPDQYYPVIAVSLLTSARHEFEPYEVIIAAPQE